MGRDLVFTSDRLPDVDGLLAAYRAGFFPMYEPAYGCFLWISPWERGVIPLREEEGLHVPRRLRQRARSRRFEITSDVAFEQVMRACASEHAREDGGTWINEEMIEAYAGLHRLGHAHSVEAWRRADQDADRHLVGGLYGVRLGGAFFAESMFCRPALGGTDAGKVCLYFLMAHLRRRGFLLLDAQFPTPHLARFGCVGVGRTEYLARLGRALAVTPSWRPFLAECDL